MDDDFHFPNVGQHRFSSFPDFVKCLIVHFDLGNHSFCAGHPATFYDISAIFQAPFCKTNNMKSSNARIPDPNYRTKWQFHVPMLLNNRLVSSPLPPFLQSKTNKCLTGHGSLPVHAPRPFSASASLLIFPFVLPPFPQPLRHAPQGVMACCLARGWE